MSDIQVQIGLEDLYSLKASANCVDIYRNERDGLKKELEAEKAKSEAAEKNLAELQKERDDLKAEADSYRRRLAEADRELKKWHDAEEADKPKADALAYLEEHDTPFESEDAEDASKVIRQLLAMKPAADKPTDTSTPENERPQQ